MHSEWDQIQQFIEYRSNANADPDAEAQITINNSSMYVLVPRAALGSSTTDEQLKTVVRSVDRATASLKIIMPETVDKL